MKKYAVFYHAHSGLYQLIEYSDISMSSLFTFLRDGLPLDSYVNFLKDAERNTFYANVCELEKNDELITVSVDQYIYAGAPSFTMTKDNMLYLLLEWRRLTDLEIDKIEIDIDGNNVSIKGEWIH